MSIPDSIIPRHWFVEKKVIIIEVCWIVYISCRQNSHASSAKLRQGRRPRGRKVGVGPTGEGARLQYSASTRLDYVLQRNEFKQEGYGSGVGIGVRGPKW